MSFELVASIFDKKPLLNEKLNINKDDEFQNKSIVVGVNEVLEKICKHKYEAYSLLNDGDKHFISAIPFLKNKIKETKKIENIYLKTKKNRLKIEEIQKEWAERSLDLNQRTCYSCGSKVIQSRSEAKNPTRISCPCPVCHASDYLLTNSLRNKIAKLKEKNEQLFIDEKELIEIEFQKIIKKNNFEVAYLVGGLIHEIDA